MASEIKNAKSGLKTRLETIGSLKHVYEYPPDSIYETPAAVILLDGVNTQQTIGGSTFIATFRVMALARSASIEEAIDLLDDMSSPLGNDSVEAAIDADNTWGGNVTDGRLISIERQRRVTIGEQDFWGIDFIVRAIVQVAT